MAAQTGVGVPEVFGVQEVLKALADVEPKLKREAIKKIKMAAEPMRASIAGQIPGEPPLSGMKGGGRLGWDASGNRKVTIKYGGKRSRDKTEWPLVTIIAGGAAASMADMAGRGSSGKTAQGQALIDGLTAEGGSPSRTVWPTAESQLASVQAAVLAAVKEVSLETNVRTAER